jgi:hypothetical protein
MPEESSRTREGPRGRLARFFTSLAGVLTAVGTLVAAGAGVYALAYDGESTAAAIPFRHGNEPLARSFARAAVAAFTNAAAGSPGRFDPGGVGGRRQRGVARLGAGARRGGRSPAASGRRTAPPGLARPPRNADERGLVAAGVDTSGAVSVERADA